MTDVYAFRSYEPGREGFVTLVANFQPLQDPGGGPNYFTMDPEARYEIKIDNDGDALEDITYRFRFSNRLKPITLAVGLPGLEKQVPIPLRYAGPQATPDAPTLNELERFWVSEVTTANGAEIVKPLSNAVNGLPIFRKPLDNVGTKTIPD